MEKQESGDDTSRNANMSAIQNNPCDGNHEMKDTKIQKDNSNDNDTSSKEDADDDKRNIKKPENEHVSRRPKSSSLKRKKLPSSHLAQTSLKNSVSFSTSAITNSPTNNEKHKEKEIRQKKITTKQIIEPKRDILQQKYQELHQLLVLPLVQPVSKNVLQIRHLLHLQTFNQGSQNEDSPDHIHDMDSDINGHYHDTSLQSTQLKALNRPLHHDTKCRSQSSTDIANDQGYGQWVRKNKNKQQNNTAEERVIEKENQVKKQIFQPSDTFLKNTNNPSIKQWLKKKEREIRKRKREERKKLKEERLKKQEQEMLKQDKFKDSELKVREWMMLKRKEAMTKVKESKQLEKDEITNSDTPRGLHLAEGSEVTSALSTGAEAQSIANVNISLKEQAVQPTPTSFVYARPVSGRVRLIKLQQLNKENAKKKELEKELFKKHLEKEKAKKMRVSYDQWLLKKREEDYTKRQEAARVRALAKSDSELHNIGVDIAQKRVKSFMRSKQNIDGNDSEQEKTLTNENKNGLQKIKVLGSKKNLNVRPSSARSSLSPRMSKTFHRPLSANPDVKLSGQAHDVEGKKTFRIPYPPESGAPKYVLDKQRKLFSPHLTQSTVYDLQKSDVSNADENNAINKLSNCDVNQTKADLNQQSTAIIDLITSKQLEVNEIKQTPVQRNGKRGRNEPKAKKENIKVSEVKDNHSILIEDTPIAKDVADTDEINNNTNKVMENKHDKQNLTILEQIIHSDISQTFADNDDDIASELEEIPETALPDANVVNEDYSSESSFEDDQDTSDVNEQYRQQEELSDVNEPHRQQKELSDVNEPHRQQEELSDVNEPHRQQKELSDINEPHRQQEELSDVNEPDRQQEELSDVNEPHRQQEELSDINEPHRQQKELSDGNEPDRQPEELSDVNEPHRQQKELSDGNEPDKQQEELSDGNEPDGNEPDRQEEELSDGNEQEESSSKQHEETSDSSVTRNSIKHVSFQESPIVFESSDTEDIHSDSSEANEIEEDLPEEDDEF